MSQFLISIPPTINFVHLFDEWELPKEKKHIPKYEYFVSLIYAEQIEQQTYVPVSNTILKKVIRQPIITRMKNNLFNMGVVECDYHMKFAMSNGQAVGYESYGYRIKCPYYFPHIRPALFQEKFEPQNKLTTPKKISSPILTIIN